MEPSAPRFPSGVAPLSDLYGASSFRVAEAQAFALELDALDREELALEQTVRALVDRKAPAPIGLSFYRAKQTTTAATASCTTSNTSSSMLNASTASTRLQRGGVAPVGTEGSRLGSGVQTTRGYHGPVAAGEEEAEEEEEEMEEEEEEEEEDGDEADELFPEDEDDDDEEEPQGVDDMDMSM